MDVGVRELKQHLSAYLERAARGEVIRVTERGRPKAVLGPIPGVARLESGFAEGWVRRGSGTLPRSVQPVAGGSSVQAALDEDRGR